MYEQQDFSIGPAAPRTRQCRFCKEEILASAQKCKHCGEFLSPAARRAAGLSPTRNTPQARDIKIPIGESVLCLLFCLPLGIVALIFAAQADAKLRTGDMNGAASAAATAKNVAALGILVSLIVFVLLVVSHL